MPVSSQASSWAAGMVQEVKMHPWAMLWTWGEPKGREINMDPDALPFGLPLLLRRPVAQHGPPALPLQAQGQLGLFPVPPWSSLPSRTASLASTPLPAKRSWFSFSSLPGSKGTVKALLHVVKTATSPERYGGVSELRQNLHMMRHV